MGGWGDADLAVDFALSLVGDADGTDRLLAACWAEAVRIISER